MMRATLMGPPPMPRKEEQTPRNTPTSRATAAPRSCLLGMRLLFFM